MNENIQGETVQLTIPSASYECFVYFFEYHFCGKCL